MKKILVPTDFSAASRNATVYAASLAKEMHAMVQLLHVYQDYPSGAMGPETWVVPLTEMRVYLQKQLNQELSFLEEKGIKGEVILEEGFRGNTISRVAEENGAELIVMGSKTENRSRFWGSTVNKVIRDTAVPMLVVPENLSYRPLRNVLLAVDFESMVTHSLFAPLQDVCQAFHSSVTVLHVEKPETPLRGREVPQKLQLSQALSGFAGRFETMEADKIEEGIREYATKHAIDLLVMVAHHHNIFERLFGTVHTRSIIFLSQQPLLILKND
ncbi:universal stress protein [Flavisolibacter nicotianae]|uniref:universal stress protein n=1 Tax=Flavisolibacter nicotianae TaxID=2364882 RepID=UPI0013C501FC|nr:universal stress protein [Flavisolibacter nicotianae]